jgi:hypothetical protein
MPRQESGRSSTQVCQNATASAIAASRPAAEEPQPIPSGISFSIRIAKGGVRPSRASRLLVGFQDQVVFEARAQIRIPAGRRNRKLGCLFASIVKVKISATAAAIESSSQDWLRLQAGAVEKNAHS